MTKVISVHMPDYHRSKTVDHEKVGGTVHQYIKQHFSGKKIVLRGLDSGEHPDLVVDELVDRIAQHGTDRYDSGKGGRGYSKHDEIELFGIQYDVDNGERTVKTLVRKFHEANAEKRGVPVKMDVYMVYDADYLENIPATKEGKPVIDQFKFKDPKKKKDALKAIIKLTS
jgi:hypothetical protein